MDAESLSWALDAERIRPRVGEPPDWETTPTALKDSPIDRLFLITEATGLGEVRETVGLASEGKGMLSSSWVMLWSKLRSRLTSTEFNVASIARKYSELDTG